MGVKHRHMWNPRRKLFICYHHRDEIYRARFDRLFNHLFINKSVCEGEIETDLSTLYIKRLIQGDYISDASVVVVLVGPRTYCRKHVDWEISAGLSRKVGGRSGLFGLCLPNHTDYLRSSYTPEIIPPRLVDNLETGYAELYDWTDNASVITDYVDRAFSRKKRISDQADNTRLQYVNNRCD
jgi:MTH538 TIR-like domain (DUF1863)